MNTPGAVLFDMDGVIFDSEPVHKEIFYQYSKKLGFEFPKDDYDALIGTTSVSQWTLMKEKYNLEGTPQELSDRKMEHYKVYLRKTSGLQPIPGITALMEELQSSRIPFALASSNTTDIIEATLKAVGLDDVVTVRVGGEEVKQAKPHPEIFLKAAGLLDVTPEQCVVIEDSTHGVQAAKSAGMRCVAFNNPNSPGQDLSKADRIIASPTEINLAELTTLFASQR